MMPFPALVVGLLSGVKGAASVVASQNQPEEESGGAPPQALSDPGPGPRPTFQPPVETLSPIVGRFLAGDAELELDLLAEDEIAQLGRPGLVNAFGGLHEGGF